MLISTICHFNQQLNGNLAIRQAKKKEKTTAKLERKWIYNNGKVNERGWGCGCSPYLIIKNFGFEGDFWFPFNVSKITAA